MSDLLLCYSARKESTRRDLDLTGPSPEPFQQPHVLCNSWSHGSLHKSLWSYLITTIITMTLLIAISVISTTISTTPSCDCGAVQAALSTR